MAIRCVKGFVLSGLTLLLSACGGGGGKTVNTTLPGQTVTSTYTMTASVQDATGQPTATVTQGTPVTGVALVTQVNTIATPGMPDRITRSPGVGLIVTFASAGGILTPSTGTALTDGNGKATIVLMPGGAAGAYALTASTHGATATVNYQIGSTLVPTLTLDLINAAGASTTEVAAGSINTVRVTALRVETQANGTPTGRLTPAPGVIITASSDGGVFDPTIGTALTGADGAATVRLLANVVDAAFQLTVKATIDGTDVTQTLGYQITVPSVQLGSGSPFVAGVLAISQPLIGAGGSTAVSVNLVDAAGQPFLPPVSIVFTSACAQNHGATLTSPVMSANGLAVSTYTAGAGCVGTDTVVANATIPGSALPLTAQGVIHIAPPTAGAITFASAIPASIALRGHGTSTQPEATAVTFMVLSATGIPVPNQRVNFALTTAAGGLSLVEAQATSDSAGHVLTHAQSGTVAVVFRVVATLDGTQISTQSQGISVSTGTADQNSFSVSATTLNPEAFNYDGVTDTVTARAGDLFHNPVADGTVIQFTTGGGSIQPSCTTTNGTCSVTWTSQAPRPPSGRAVVLAYTPGDESFVDLNGNGVFSGNDTWTDLPEAFRDDNENGQYDPGEFFVDANGNGHYDGPNGLYDGALCDPSTHKCGQSKSVDVRGSLVIVMATSHAVIYIVPSTIHITSTGSASVRIEVSDDHGNLPAMGTTITATSSKGMLQGTATWTVGNSNARGPFVAFVTLSGTATDSGTGTFNVAVMTPGGTLTNGQALVQVDAPTAPAAAVEQAVSLQVTPSAVTVHPGQSLQVPVAIRAVSRTGERVSGVMPVVSCFTGGASHLYLVPLSGQHPITAGNDNAMPSWPITATAAMKSAGSGTCTFVAGPLSATMKVEVAPQ